MTGKLFSLLAVILLIEYGQVCQAVPVPETSVEHNLNSLKIEPISVSSEEENEHYKKIMVLLETDLHDLIKYFLVEDRKVLKTVLEKTETTDMTDAMKEERKTLEGILHKMDEFKTSESKTKLNDLYTIFKDSLAEMMKYDPKEMKDPTTEQTTMMTVMKENGVPELLTEFENRLDTYAGKINTETLAFMKDHKMEPKIAEQVEGWHKKYDDEDCLLKKFDIFSSFMDTIVATE
ncbi:uncharacterized protein LOC119689681 [Teleopsis dalmanni]|uniref:uncharacterized protein LOC119689681 n=1 Tax=Teleopsis dalmanni TaxID=139649 RepID=UPI000D32947D|nr:uncharacterized protein LOC119689681 [Teleopsis dalmanni]